MHGGIAILMGLMTFSWIMLSVELPLVGDRRLEAVGRYMRERASAVTAALPRRAGVRSA